MLIKMNRKKSLKFEHNSFSKMVRNIVDSNIPQSLDYLAWENTYRQTIDGRTDDDKIMKCFYNADSTSFIPPILDTGTICHLSRKRAYLVHILQVNRPTKHKLPAKENAIPTRGEEILYFFYEGYCLNSVNKSLKTKLTGLIIFLTADPEYCRNNVWTTCNTFQ